MTYAGKKAEALLNDLDDVCVNREDDIGRVSRLVREVLEDAAKVIEHGHGAAELLALADKEIADGHPR